MNNPERQMAEARLIVDLVKQNVAKQFSDNGKTFLPTARVDQVVPFVIVLVIQAMAAQRMLNVLEQHFGNPEQ